MTISTSTRIFLRFVVHVSKDFAHPQLPALGTRDVILLFIVPRDRVRRAKFLGIIIVSLAIIIAIVVCDAALSYFRERPLNELARSRPSEVMSRYSMSA